jgi:hypothetical protein
MGFRNNFNEAEDSPLHQTDDIVASQARNSKANLAMSPGLVSRYQRDDKSR